MKIKVMIFILFVTMLISSCSPVSRGAYWEFGKGVGNPFNQIFLVSMFDCEVFPKNNLYSATCINRETKDIYHMMVPYYKTGEDWVRYQ